MRKRPVLLLFLLVYFYVAVGAGIAYLQISINQKQNQVLGDSFINPVIAYEDSFTESSSRGLAKIVDPILINTRGTYGIDIVNMKTGEHYSKNEHKSFQSASLYKLWVMGEVVNTITSDRLKETDVLQKTVSELNTKFKIASEEAELQEGNITMTVSEALEKMITVSDNYAALLLSDRIGSSKVSTYLKQNNFYESSFNQPPMTTAHDITKFFMRLYFGQLADEEYSNTMLTLLKRQRLNGKLPKYLPPGTIVAHKTGELGTVTHDAGIVYTQNGDYIITILTNTIDPEYAEEIIAKISENVFAYFTNQH